MKHLTWLGLLLLLFGSEARAFLGSSDPRNFFELLESAPVAATVKVNSAAEAKTDFPFRLYELKKLALLQGPGSMESWQVAEERLTQAQPPYFKEGEERLVFLAPLPDYTSYRELRAKGYAWRVYGGKAGIWPLAESQAWARSYLLASGPERETVLLQAVAEAAPGLRAEAALWLARRGPLPLRSEQAQSLAAFARLQPASPAGLAAVRVLETAANEPARQSLLELAQGPSAPVKWAAIRALEKLGSPRNFAQLVEDYHAADAAGKAQALALIASKRNEEAGLFFSALLAGPSDLETKREAIQGMVERKNASYERILLQQVGRGDESVQAEAILALGKMRSTEAVPLVIPLLDSPSSKLRGAAFFMLSDSPDPRARALISQRYERDHHGGWEKSPHFYGNP